MGVRGLIIFAAVLCSLVATCYGEGVFADLRNTLTVSASPSGRGNKNIKNIYCSSSDNYLYNIYFSLLKMIYM